MARRMSEVSAVVRRIGDTFVTTDMDLAVYCHMLHRLGEQDLPVLDVVRVSRGCHEFTFRDARHVIRKVEVDWANERAANFAAAQRSLKRIMRKVKVNTCGD